MDTFKVNEMPKDEYLKYRINMKNILLLLESRSNKAFLQ